MGNKWSTGMNMAKNHRTAGARECTTKSRELKKEPLAESLLTKRFWHLSYNFWLHPIHTETIPYQTHYAPFQGNTKLRTSTRPYICPVFLNHGSPGLSLGLSYFAHSLQCGSLSWWTTVDQTWQMVDPRGLQFQCPVMLAKTCFLVADPQTSTIF